MADLLIAGVHGQLGSSLERLARPRRLEVSGHDIDTLDIRDPDAVERAVVAARPATVINCAAYTEVDGCELDQDTAMAVNGTAVGHLAAACNVVGARLLQISTDYVFAGDQERPYYEDDATGPVSAYGRSKLAGERLAATADRHLIVRTAWLYGHGGRNFVEAIRRQLESGTRPLRVVADQVGSPTFCDDLAEAILALDGAGATGIVHAVNTGATSWHGFAHEIVRLLGADVEVLAIATDDMPRPAPRPAYSVLDTSRLGSLLGRQMPTWQDGLARYMGATCGS